jgi:hypothetical protein
MNNAANPFEMRFQSSRTGLKANTSGKIFGKVLGRASGAERAGGENDNLWAIDGESVRFHSVNGGKSTFTLNPATEPPRLIVALTKDKPDGDKPPRYWLYGLTLGACKQEGRPAKSASAGRLIVSVGQIQDRIELGYADLPTEYAEITTVTERDAALSRIDQMTPEELAIIISAATREKIRAFILAGREQPTATTTLGAPPTTDDAVWLAEQRADATTGELEPAPVVELPSAEPEGLTVAEPAPAEAPVEGDRKYAPK